MWEELLPTKLAAQILVRRLAAEGVGWAGELVETVWVDDELQALLDRLP